MAEESPLTNETLKNERVLPGYSYSLDYDKYERLCRGEETEVR